MFVVVVTHSTGHGESSIPILVTKSISKAVKTARDIENFDYEFYSKETGVGVYRLEEGRSYRKKEFKWLFGKNPPPAVIFYRRILEIHSLCSGLLWEEEWFDDKSQVLVDGFQGGIN